MINTDNYYFAVKDVDFTQLPEMLQKGHAFVDKTTQKGENWIAYEKSDSIRKVIDSYFDKLTSFLDLSKKEAKEKPSGQKAQSKDTKEKSPAAIIAPETTELVERIPDELRFIKRYVNMHGKSKTKEDLLRFINALQRAILERRIRKTSKYAEQIRYIQATLLKVYNGMKGKALKVEINSKTLEEFYEIVGGEKVYPSISFIKRFVAMHGKPGMKQKAKQLLSQIERSIKKGKIRSGDKYEDKLKSIVKVLQRFISSKDQQTLPIDETELNGLMGILGDCNCNMSGLGEIGDHVQPKPQIMNSVDFAKLQFNTLGFQGKWLSLIGDPSPGFTAMVFGKPKMGKSYLCIDFAGYLARNHGRVLYVAKEEGLDATLQMKLNDKNVKHPNLYVSAFLPDRLKGYSFVILDSVNKLGLNPEDLTKLKIDNPGVSFVFVFQSTKEGNFRGNNGFQHDVDVVIEVPEKGRAVQFGRFNQGGETRIFGGPIRAAA